MSSSKPTFQVCELNSLDLNGLPVLDVVDDALGRAETNFRIFFSREAPLDQVAAAFEKCATSISSVNKAAIVRSDTLPNCLNAARAEPELFDGRNVAVAVRNGEPVETVMDWLLYHFDHFGVDGVVVFNRTQKGCDKDFVDSFQKHVEKSGKPLCVVVLESERPLGHFHAPPEQHPFCVAEAPGRDRMTVPPADPWHAPLAEASIYEIARRRFLQKARAIANIDICDLLFDPVIAEGSETAENPFDVAASNPDCAVQLLGQHCYPWRVRKSMHPSFGDHICVQFDNPKHRVRWCVSPQHLKEDQLLKFLRVSDMPVYQTTRFFRFMAVRHPVRQISKIVPKTSLIESDRLIALSEGVFDFKPVRAPAVALKNYDTKATRTAIVTTMKNEGPFILEWIAYHQAIGVRDFLVFTNDCTDGTDAMFDLLESKGIVQHRENPFREMDVKPQHAALQAAENEPVVQNADWVICMDVDEFLNIKVGEGRLQDLYHAVGDANMISCTWRLFGNSDLHEFEDGSTIGMFSRCAEEFTPKPHQAWGFKTLHRNNGIFKKMGVHRPKGLRPQIWEHIRWVNGSGQPMPKTEYRNAWRSTVSTYGYDLVSLNHYAVRNAESFLVKRDRGRVNHVDRDQGLAYWFRMNNNATEDFSIQSRIPMMEEKLKELMADPDIAAQHHSCVAAHRAKIQELKAHPDQLEFLRTLTKDRMEKLSRMHQYFGSSVFLTGPQCVPDDIIWSDLPDGFLFTVERSETQH